MPQSVPVWTTDSNLALALELAGCQRIAVWNVYTKQKLKDLQCENVTEARASNQPGQVRYFFEPSEKMQGLVKAYFDQRQRNAARQPSESIGELVPEDLVRIACSVLMLRKEYVALWKNCPTKFQEGGEVDEVVTETVTVTQEMEDAAKREGKEGVTMNGIRFAVGSQMPTAIQRNVSPMKLVDVSMSAEKRAEIGL